MLIHLSLVPSFGFGDRLGLATPGHIAAVRGTRFAPVFAQQSVRENARTRQVTVITHGKRCAEKFSCPEVNAGDHALPSQRRRVRPM